MKRKIFSMLFVFSVSMIMPLMAQVNDTLHKKIKIGYFADSVFHVGQKDSDRKSGYGYEYYQELAKYTDWDYEYVYGTWNDVYKKFLRGEIDIIDAVSKTSERERFMLFSEEPMGTDYFYIFTLAENTTISEDDLLTLNGKKIGANANSTNVIFLEKFLKENNLDAEIVLCDGYAQRMARMLTGEIDAMVSTDALAAENLRMIVNIATEDFYFAVNPSKPELMAELNAAQKKLLQRNPGYENTLRNKYFNKAIVRNNLDANEKQWIAVHPVLKVGYKSHCMPFCAQNDEGELFGLLSDVLKSLEKNIGIRFETIPFESSNHMSTAVREGKVDLIFPVCDDMWYSEKNGYINTNPIIQNRFSLVFSGDYKTERKNLKIGYLSESSAQELILERYQAMNNAVPFETTKELFNAILKGDADCSILNSDIVNYNIKKDVRFSKLQVANLDEYIGYSFGMARDNAVLYSIIEMGISRLINGLITESINRYSLVTPELSFSTVWLKYKNYFMTGLIIILAVILIIVILYSRSLNKERRKVVSAREKALKDYADARTDPLTGARNRRAYYEVLEDHNNGAEPFVVGFLDIDDFKEFNNRYGHETGDQVLRFIVKSMNYAFPGSFVGRFGGDEFVLISDTPVDIAAKQAREFLRIIGDGIVIRETGIRVPVGSSVGLVQVTRKVQDIRDIQNQADIAMYRAKGLGKNQVFVDR